jgi:tetratricopeptide (TPR) repeat protein
MALWAGIWCGIALTGILLSDAPSSAVAAEPSGGQIRGQPTWLSSAGAQPQPEAVQPPPMLQRQQGIQRTHELLAQARGQRSSLYPPEVLEWQHQVDTLYQQGKYQEAAQIQKKVLAWTEQNLGPDNPDTATGLNNLAVLYRNQGANAKAEPLYLRALAIREKALGPDHPDTAQSLDNLAMMYSSQGAYAKAEPLFIRALAIRERTPGLNHPSTIKSRENLEQFRKALVGAAITKRQSTLVADAILGSKHKVITNSSGKIIGINNLGIGDKQYNVKFYTGSFENLYMDRNLNPPFKRWLLPLNVESGEPMNAANAINAVLNSLDKVPQTVGDDPQPRFPTPPALMFMASIIALTDRSYCIPLEYIITERTYLKVKTDTETSIRTLCSSNEHLSSLAWGVNELSFLGTGGSVVYAQFTLIE